jgi:hypothetical protein
VQAMLEEEEAAASSVRGPVRVGVR